MKPYVLKNISTFGVFLFIFGLVSSHIIGEQVTDDLSNVADELHELLNVNIQRPPAAPKENLNWIGPSNVGQITGVAVNSLGKPVIFHRGDRTWNFRSFDNLFQFREAYRGPIRQDTVLTLNPQSGFVESSWGADLFFLPHGLHIDVNGYVWLTDVALHQVFKFKPDSLNPDLVLGESFVPGSDFDHFCQPTSVAVAKTGEIIVADGYCNSRLMIFHHSGKLINIIPQTESISLNVPHALAIVKRGDVCVADRENMRVICFPLQKNFQTKYRRPTIIQEPELGRVFGIAAFDDLVYAVNGPTAPGIPIRGFLMDPRFNVIINHWNLNMEHPHAMAISPNHTELYITEIGPNIIKKFDLI